MSSDGTCIPSGWWYGATGTRTAPMSATSSIACRPQDDDSNVIRITTGGATMETVCRRRFGVTGGPTARTAATKVWMECPELSCSKVDEGSGTEQIWMVVFSLLSTSTLAHPDQVQVGRRESRSLGDFEKVQSRRRRRSRMIGWSFVSMTSGSSKKCH